MTGLTCLSIRIDQVPQRRRVPIKTRQCQGRRGVALRRGEPVALPGGCCGAGGLMDSAKDSTGGGQQHQHSELIREARLMIRPLLMQNFMLAQSWMAPCCSV